MPSKPQRICHHQLNQKRRKGFFEGLKLRNKK
jgi:hypothetical protein